MVSMTATRPKARTRAISGAVGISEDRAQHRADADAERGGGDGADGRLVLRDAVGDECPTE